MTKRLQVLFEDDEYRLIQMTARRERVTVAEWVRQALRTAQKNRSLSLEEKMRAISLANQHQFPTSDIDQMLSEIADGNHSE